MRAGAAEASSNVGAVARLVPELLALDALRRWGVELDAEDGAGQAYAILQDDILFLVADDGFHEGVGLFMLRGMLRVAFVMPCKLKKNFTFCKDR